MSAHSAAAVPSAAPAAPSAGVSSGPDARARASFERALREQRPNLYRYAVWLTRDPHLADDAVQEALIRAWRFWGRLRHGQALKPWLLTIVRRECARIYSRKQLDTRDVDALCGAEQILVATADDTDVADLRAAVLRLDAAYREPLVLQVLMGFSADEIARVMGLKRGAVLTRLFRARRKLAHLLDVEQLDEGGS